MDSYSLSEQNSVLLSKFETFNLKEKAFKEKVENLAQNLKKKEKEFQV
jgi:hypothetical protein